MNVLYHHDVGSCAVARYGGIGDAVDIGKLTPKKLEKALDLELDEDVEALDLGLSVGIDFQNGDEKTHYTINSDGSISEDHTYSEETSQAAATEPHYDQSVLDGPIDTLRIGDSYDPEFLRKYGKSIKRIVASGYGYINYITLANCPNVEEFIVNKNSVFSFEDGVLYSKKGNKRTIEYITKNVEHLHIDADVSDVSSYWHGVKKISIDPDNGNFTVQGNMLLSRRKNSLYFVTSDTEELIIPEGVTQIHARAIEYCDKLKKISFPSTYEWKEWHGAHSDPLLITSESMKTPEITVNGDNIMCENSLVIRFPDTSPNAVFYLGDYENCYIPAKLTSTFGFNSTFKKVKNFIVDENNPSLSSVDGVILNKDKTTLVFYPPGRDTFVLPDTVREIASHSAAYNDFTEVVIPEHVRKIGKMAFSNCALLKSVKTLSPETETDEEAYFGCNLLNGENRFDPVDEDELKRSIAEEIWEIQNGDNEESLFGSLFGWTEERADDVRISDDNNRTVIVDNKWAFDLPEGINLRFDSEHVDIMGNSTTAKYVVEGLEHNGRFFFDFELRERVEDGVSSDVDVIGCRNDNDVASGNAQQKIIIDGDDLFVDLVSKPVFFFNSMAMIRVRGDGMRSWDFTAGLKNTDQEMSARWDEVQDIMKDLAGSIRLLDGATKSEKKKKAKKEKKGSASAEVQSESNKLETTNDGLAYATPDESLYPHYNSKQATQNLGFPGVKVVVNQSGTEYQFYQLLEDLDDDASEEMKAAVSKISDKGAASYKLAEKASEMRKVFHVTPEAFDFRHDKECELAENLMQKAYMMSALRSFAWTLSKYCDDNKTDPKKLTLEQIQNIVDFVADRGWLNYDGESYCKGLCGTSDLHVYYLPDKTPASVKKVFEPSEEELEQTRKMQEQFPSFNPIFSQTGSLDALRKDLEYIYPAIEKIYEDVKESRDYNEPLTGNDGDVLYSWCALAYAARGPFFSEDGPMTCWFSQIETEEERQKKEEERRKEEIELRAEISKQFMSSYGEYIEENPSIEFKDKKFVFTGLKARIFGIGDDTDYEGLIEAKGGFTRKSVSGVTDYLVVDPAGAGDSKISKAIENQESGKPTKIILMEDLRKALGLPADDSELTIEKTKVKATSVSASVSSTAPAPKASGSSSSGKSKASKPAAGEKTVTVDNTWTVTIPAGYKYSTDKNKIGGHRNIIFMEDKADNSFEWPFDATISFTSQFNESQGVPAPIMARTMAGIFGDNINVIREDDDIFVGTYLLSQSTGEGDADVYKIDIGCGNGVSNIQVFFNKRLSRREEKKLVETVAKSVRLAGEETSFTASSASPLSSEQQRQKAELDRQIKDLKSQAEFYSSQDLSAEDRETLSEAKKDIEKLGKQLDDVSADQAKFEEYLRQKEEREKQREEERKRKAAEAKAAGKGENDLINMFVILCNENKVKVREKTQKEFFDAYGNYFPGYKTRELGDLRKEVKAKIKDKETRRYYTESFMKRSVKDRFDVVTTAYFSLDQYADYTLRAEDAVIKTAEWFTPEEMPEVRRLMEADLNENRKEVDNAFDPVEKKWKSYWSAKEFLKIVVRDGSGENVRNDCRQFQTLVANNILTGPLMVEVSLATKGMFQMSTPVMDYFPCYWGTSRDEIWETARKNEIKDESTAYIEDINESVRTAIRQIKESNLDTKATLKQWQDSANGSARVFVDYISMLYDKIDQHYTVSDIKEKLKTSYKTANDLAEGKEKLFEYAKKANLVSLQNLLSMSTDIKEIYESTPKTLAEDIKKIRSEKQLEENDKKYKEATELISTGEYLDLIKAGKILESLKGFKDSNNLLKEISASVEEKKSEQYDEAISLFNEGTEDSIIEAIDKLDELDKFKDAPDLADTYRKILEKERIYNKATVLLNSENLEDLQNAEKNLAEINDYKDSETLLAECRKRMDVVREVQYVEAINLAAEGSEQSLSEALSLMDSISPYRDSGSKIIEFKNTLEHERTYQKAISSMNGTDIGTLIETREIFEELGDYRDSSRMASECDKTIEGISEKTYKEALEAERECTVESQKNAIAKFSMLGSYKDSFDRKNQCEENCKTIEKIQELNREIEDDKKELAAITGAFKNKERRAKEAQIQSKEQQVAQLKMSLPSNAVENDTQSQVDCAESIVVGEKIAEEGTQSYGSAEKQAPKKKSKKGLIFIVIILLLAAVAAGLYATGVLYISPDADECVVEEYRTDSSYAGIKTITIEKYKDGVDSDNNYYLLYKVTNTSGEDIWSLYGDVAYYDKNGKELYTDGISYQGMLKPDKYVYLLSSTYDIKPEKIALVKINTYEYSVGPIRYYLDEETGKLNKGASSLEDYNNADFDTMNVMTFDINNRGVDEYNYYNVDVTAMNNGSSSIHNINYYVDFLDADENVIYSGSGSVENELAPSRSLMSEASGYEYIEGDGTTKRISSTVITRYEYYLDSDDRYGNNYYFVDLVNKTAYGTHYDE